MALFQNFSHLHTAVEAGDAATVAALVRQYPKWVHEKEKHTEDTALHKAARKGDVTIMKILIDAGAHVNGWNAKYNTALHLAAESGKVDAVKLVLDTDASAISHLNSKTSGGETVLQKAIKSGNADTLDLLLKSGKADLNADNPPAVYYAVQCDQLEALRILLQAGADPNVAHTPERTREHYYRSNYNERDYLPRSPLNEALTRNSTPIAMLLLDKGAKERENECLMHLAASHGNLELAAELLALGRNVNARNPYAETPLHIAAQKASPPMVALLLANGADRGLIDSNKRTALSMAQQFALKENIDLLVGNAAPAEAVKRKPVALAPADQPLKPIPAPEPVKPGNDPLFDDESWKLAGRMKLVHINFYPELGRRMTEIFNFESRERTVISENLHLRTEAMTGQSFDKIGEEALTKALVQFRKLGGTVDENAVFKDRMLKVKPKF